MKYFQMDGTINEELVGKFMDFFNSNLENEITIVINSGGGKSTLSTLILSIINENSERITLISAGVYSAAFYIFYFAKCKRKIIHGSLGMHHKEYLSQIFIGDDGKPKYEDDKCQIKNLTATRSNFIKKIMTKKEKTLYKNHDDVYFTFKRMKEIFPDVDIIK